MSVVDQSGSGAALLASPQPRVNLVLVFACYLAAACAMGLLATPMAPTLAWEMPAAQIVRNLMYGDPTSFLKGAADIATHGWVTPENYWLVHLWPPGFMVMEALLLRAFGEAVPI